MNRIAVLISGMLGPGLKTSLPALLASAVCLALTPAANAAIVNVTIVDYTYQPDTADIVQGDSVVWTNTSNMHPHTSTSGAAGVPDGLWNSGTLTQGQSFGHKFPDVGLFPYYCAFHYPINNMSGAISVRSAGVDENQASPGTPARLSAYPSPFSDRVVFSYRLGIRGESSLEVFDVLGRVVRSLAIDDEPGEHQATWDGSGPDGQNVARGVYIARLSSNAGVISTRIVKLN
jgi:plastocyanin